MAKNIEKTLTKMTKKIGEDHIEVVEEAKQSTVYVTNEKLIEFLNLLKEKEGFGFLADLTAADYEEHFETIYHLMSLEDCSEIRVKVKLSKENPCVTSLVSLWNAADVQEREAYDMFGINFEGHPDLKTILLPDDFEGHPLRKDFKLDTGARER